MKPYKLHRFASGSGFAIKQFEQLQNDIVNGNANINNIDCQSLINAIVDYVNDIQALQNTPDRKWITKQIHDAPNLSRVRVYDYMPGTGQATKQFYKFAKAMSSGAINCKKLSVESLLLMIGTYFFDQIE